MMKELLEEKELTAGQGLPSADSLSRLVIELGIDFVDAEPDHNYVVWTVLQECAPGEYRTVQAIWSMGAWWEIPGEADVAGEISDNPEGAWLPVTKLEIGISRKIWHEDICDND